MIVAENYNVHSVQWIAKHLFPEAVELRMKSVIGELPSFVSSKKQNTRGIFLWDYELDGVGPLSRDLQNQTRLFKSSILLLALIFNVVFFIHLQDSVS